jgi:hypothetical protein
MIDQAVIKISFLDRKRNQRGLNPMQKFPKIRNHSSCAWTQIIDKTLKAFQNIFIW